jgi:hypothetical protein
MRCITSLGACLRRTAHAPRETTGDCPRISGGPTLICFSSRISHFNLGTLDGVPVQKKGKPRVNFKSVDEKILSPSEI